MNNVDMDLYKTNAFYRELVDEMREIEQKQKKLQREQDTANAKREANHRRQMIGYANQIPYSSMIPVSPYQWSVPYTTVENNFVSYWSRAWAQKQIAQEERAARQEILCGVFHGAADIAAFAAKQNAPLASIILDGVGLLTAANLAEATKSAMSILDTVNNMSGGSGKDTDDSQNK